MRMPRPANDPLARRDKPPPPSAEDVSRGVRKDSIPPALCCDRLLRPPCAENKGGRRESSARWPSHKPGFQGLFVRGGLDDAVILDHGRSAVPQNFIECDREQKLLLPPVWVTGYPTTTSPGSSWTPSKRSIHRGSMATTRFASDEVPLGSRRHQPELAAPSEPDDIAGLFEDWPVRSKRDSP